MFYIELTLMPSNDIGHYFLWEKVYRQLHLALVENKQPDGSSATGLAFPEYSSEHNRLGQKLRLFASDSDTLNRLDINRWLNRLTDYIHITSVRPVPDSIKHYARYSRLNTKATPEHLARRAAKRKNIPYEQALKERAHLKPGCTQLPFIQVTSLSNGERFKLFIKAAHVAEEAIPQNSKESFSLYGLSRNRGLPHF